MVSTPNQYPVILDPGERESLEDIARNGHAPAKKIRHAQVLLMSDHNRPGGKMAGPDIAAALGMHLNTVARIRKLFATRGERPALERKPRAVAAGPPQGRRPPRGAPDRHLHRPGSRGPALAGRWS